ncbi:MAG TPA: hypothetical protein PK339_05540 [Flavitalea sp.]|nr:hypothetical protein [Flavitalea sp.]
MPDRFPYKLSQYEIQPPSAAWEKLDQWLRTEYHGSDRIIQEKLAGSEIAPPPLSWEKIKAGLPDTATASREKQRPEVAIPGYKRLAAAAALIAITAIAAFYFFIPSTQKAPASLATADSPQKPMGLTTLPQEPASDASYPASADPGEAIQRRHVSGTKAAKTEAAGASSDQDHFSSESIQATDIDEDRLMAENFISSADLSEINAVVEMQPVAVKAPPIRDERGQIIMDVNLVRSPNSPHIVVTSPNGAQTRISNKFLHCLSYLNAYVASETNIEGKVWEARFQEWRNQLLREAAFVPTADNFLDIFELKEMILENR